MIYREKIGNVKVEYEGTVEEILTFMNVVSEQHKKNLEDSIKKVIQQSAEEAPLPGEFPIKDPTYH